VEDSQNFGNLRLARSLLPTPQCAAPDRLTPIESDSALCCPNDDGAKDKLTNAKSNEPTPSSADGADGAAQRRFIAPFFAETKFPTRKQAAGNVRFVGFSFYRLSK
jgi:hypothetical protein